MGRRDKERNYFRAVRVVAKLKSQLYILGAKQSLLEEEINKATAEVQRQKARIANVMELTVSEVEAAQKSRLEAIRMVRERISTLSIVEARDLVDEAVPHSSRS